MTEATERLAKPVGNEPGPALPDPRSGASRQVESFRLPWPRWLGSVYGGKATRPAGAGGRHLAARPLTGVGLVWLAALIILLATKPGQIFFDTKLGVDIDPLTFYARLWHLWNPLEWFGTLQDQYIGYAFPMLPFYLAGQLLHVPVWITERVWLSVLIAVGFLGVVRLAAALGIGSQRSRTLAGLVFALWPTFTIIIGSTAAAILPGLLAPWAVLPLVRAARAPARGPVLGPAARSGIAVACMGGVNATATLDALLLPALFIVMTARGRARVRLAASWLLAVALATSWWSVPLLLQGRYSFNFLPYIEQSSTTTSTMSAAAALRGSGNWTAYFNLGQPWLSAGWALVSSPFAVLASALAAGLGLAGIARADLPYACWIRLGLGLAALAALIGYAGPLGSPLHATVDQLLNGPLAPLRNVYKFEPALGALVALGIAHALTGWRSRTAAWPSWPRFGGIDLVTVPVAALMLAGLALPYLTGQVLNPGTFTRVPGYWYLVARYLRSHSPRAPALVIPASSHGQYVWGNPIDDPLEPLGQSPWAELGIVPYGGAGSQLFLDSVTQAFASGGQVPGLATTLARAGIRYVVVRNDLSPAALGYQPPAAMHLTLASSGFRRAAAFGPPVGGGQSHRAVEVYTAGGAAGSPSPVAMLPVSHAVLVDGGPDGLLQLAGQGILSTQAAVIAGDPLVSRPATWAVTDSLRRTDHGFGIAGSAASYTYTATETNPVDDPLGEGGGPPRELLPAGSSWHQTVAVLTGAAAVTASSAGSWLTETPQIDPVNAFDGNPATYWSEASPVTAVGQWIQISFRHPRTLPRAVGISLLYQPRSRPVIDRLIVSSQAGRMSDPVSATSAVQRLRVPAGPSRWLRITIAGAHGGYAGGPGVGIADVLIPGVTVTRVLQPAQDRAGQQAPAVAFSFSNPVPSPASLADLAAYPRLARTFRTAAAGTFRLNAAAIAVPGSGLDAILGRLTPAGRHAVLITASSTLGSLPRLAPANLLGKGQARPWIAGGINPALQLRWHGDRVIRRLVLTPAGGYAAAPVALRITSPAGSRYASVGIGGLAQIVPPLRTDRMTITFPVVQYATTVDPISGQTVQLPVGLSGLSVPALAGLRPAVPRPGATFRVGCGQGPVLTVDGQSYQTQVSGTVADLTAFRQVSIALCTPGSALRLQSGRHWLTVSAAPGTFAVTGMALGSGTAAASRTGSSARAVRVLSWQPERRTLRVGPGAAAYLEIHQNANAGWIATLNGHPLRAAQLDGWQQAFIVPAGAGGIVKLSFAPTGFYHAWLLVSAAGFAALALAALMLGYGRGPQRHARRRPLPLAQVWWQITALPGAVVGGDVARSVPAPGAGPAASGTAAAAATGLVAVAALLLLVGGPVVVAVPVLAAVLYWRPRAAGWVALAGMAAAGAFTAAATARPASPGTGAFGWPAQACAMIALAAAVMPGLAPLGSWRGRGQPVLAAAAAEPAASAAPEPAASAAPEPAVTAAPEPAVTAAPEPAVTAAPEPAASAARPAPAQRPGQPS